MVLVHAVPSIVTSIITITIIGILIIIRSTNTNKHLLQEDDPSPTTITEDRRLERAPLHRRPKILHRVSIILDNNDNRNRNNTELPCDDYPNMDRRRLRTHQDRNNAERRSVRVLLLQHRRLLLLLQDSMIRRCCQLLHRRLLLQDSTFRRHR